MGTKERIFYRHLGLEYPEDFYVARREAPQTILGIISRAEDFNEADYADREDYKALVQSRTAIEDRLFAGDRIPLGYVTPLDSEEAVIEIVHAYNNLVREALRVPGLSYDEQEAIRTRMVPEYQNFIDCFSASPHLVLKHWDYEDNPRRAAFLRAYQPTIQSYVTLLQNCSAALHDFFLLRLQAIIPEKERLKHTYISGKTGSGKSELIKLLIYAYLRKPDYGSVVLIEPHGDLSEEVARLKENVPPPAWYDFDESEEAVGDDGYDTLEFVRSLGALVTRDHPNRLVYIDPAGIGGAYVSLNPFQLDDRSDASIDIATQQIVAVFQTLIPEAGLSVNMDVVLEPCVATLLRVGNATLRDLRTFMDDNQNRHLVDLGKQSPNEDHRSFFIHRFHVREYNQTKQAIFSRIQKLLNSQSFARFIAQPSTFNLREALDGKKLIVFRLSKGIMGEESALVAGRFVVAMIQAVMWRRVHVPPAQRVPCHLFLDEFQNYMSGNLELIMTELRKYGLHLTLANQYVGQQMDAKFQEALFSCSNIKIIGPNTIKSLQTLAKDTGADLEKLQALQCGEFMVKCGTRRPFKLYTPDTLLGNRHAMKSNQWHVMLRGQRDRYYRTLQPVPEASENAQLHEDIQVSAPTPPKKGSAATPKPKFDL